MKLPESFFPYHSFIGWEACGEPARWAHTSVPVWCAVRRVPHAERVVRALGPGLEAVQEFVVGWRQHFLVRGCRV